jgi:hypothetical protein
LAVWIENFLFSRLNPAYPARSKVQVQQKQLQNMTKKSLIERLAAAVLPALMWFAVSCDDRLELSPADSQHIQNEAQTNGFFEDADDMAGMALTADAAPLTGARESSGRAVPKERLDGRFACAEVTLELATDNSPQRPRGVIIINFGDGCQDGRGNQRKGIIRVAYTGRRFAPGSTVVTTFTNYSVNDIRIEGTRTVTNTSTSSDNDPQFVIELTDGKATWPDQTVATRTSLRTRTWVRANSPTGDFWRVTGTASGTNRNGRTYAMEILEPLVFTRGCANGNRLFMPVEGVKQLTVDGRVITIDYGDGACDRKVTVTVNGKAQEVEVRGNA